MLPRLGAVLALAALALLFAGALGEARSATAATAEGTTFARPPAPWHAAAEAIRRGNSAAAHRLLEPLTESDGVAAREASLVLGLLAVADRELDRGAALLRAAAEPDGDTPQGGGRRAVGGRALFDHRIFPQTARAAVSGLVRH